MHRKLIKLFCFKRPRHKCADGFTLTEVVVASILLVIAIVPILRGFTIAYANSRIIECKSQSLVLAEAKLDEIRARSIHNFSSTFTETSTSLAGSYLCNVVDTTIDSNLKQITVSVGYDQNNNSNLATNEIVFTLSTYIANRT